MRKKRKKTTLILSPEEVWWG